MRSAMSVDRHPLAHLSTCAASSPIRFAEQTRPLETLQRSADVTAFPANHTPGLGGGGSMVTANTVFVFDVEGLNTAGDAHVRCTYSAQQPRRPSKHVPWTQATSVQSVQREHLCGGSNRVNFHGVICAVSLAVSVSRRIKLAVLRLLSYYRGHGGQWGYTFFKSGAGTNHLAPELQALLCPSSIRRRTSYTFDDDGYHFLERDIDIFCRASPPAIDASPSKMQTCTAGVEALRRVGMALQELFRGWVWHVAPVSEEPGKKGHVAKRVQNTVILFSACPLGDGELLQRANMQQSAKLEELYRTLGKDPLQQLFQAYQMVLHWVEAHPSAASVATSRENSFPTTSFSEGPEQHGLLHAIRTLVHSLGGGSMLDLWNLTSLSPVDVPFASLFHALLLAGAPQRVGASAKCGVDGALELTTQGDGAVRSLMKIRLDPLDRGTDAVSQLSHPSQGEHDLTGVHVIIRCILEASQVSPKNFVYGGSFICRQVTGVSQSFDCDGNFEKICGTQGGEQDSDMELQLSHIVKALSQANLVLGTTVVQGDRRWPAVLSAAGSGTAALQFMCEGSDHLWSSFCATRSTGPTVQAKDDVSDGNCHPCKDRLRRSECDGRAALDGDDTLKDCKPGIVFRWNCLEGWSRGAREHIFEGEAAVLFAGYAARRAFARSELLSRSESTPCDNSATRMAFLKTSERFCSPIPRRKRTQARKSVESIPERDWFVAGADSMAGTTGGMGLNPERGITGSRKRSCSTVPAVSASDSIAGCAVDPGVQPKSAVFKNILCVYQEYLARPDNRDLFISDVLPAAIVQLAVCDGKPEPGALENSAVAQFLREHVLRPHKDLARARALPGEYELQALLRLEVHLLRARAAGVLNAAPASAASAEETAAVCSEAAALQEAAACVEGKASREARTWRVELREIRSAISVFLASLPDNDAQLKWLVDVLWSRFGPVLPSTVKLIAQDYDHLELPAKLNTTSQAVGIDVCVTLPDEALPKKSPGTVGSCTAVPGTCGDTLGTSPMPLSAGLRGEGSAVNQKRNWLGGSNSNSVRAGIEDLGTQCPPTSDTTTLHSGVVEREVSGINAALPTPDLGSLGSFRGVPRSGGAPRLGGHQRHGVKIKLLREVEHSKTERKKQRLQQQRK